MIAAGEDLDAIVDITESYVGRGFYDRIHAVQKRREILGLAERVRALDPQGEPFTLEAEGLLAVCIQHEMDHLDGKLFVDYLSELKRQRVRKKIEKERKLRAEGRADESSRAPAI